MLKFGECTTKYPFGYGYCQCGCGLRTNKLGGSTYATYKMEHHPRSLIRTADREARRESTESPNARRAPTKAERITLSYGESHTSSDAVIGGRKGPAVASPTMVRDLYQQDQRILDRYCDLNAEVIALRSRVALLESEIEFTVKYLMTFLQGDPATVNTIVHRLRASLRKDTREDRP